MLETEVNVSLGSCLSILARANLKAKPGLALFVHASSEQAIHGIGEKGSNVYVGKMGLCWR